MRQMCFRLLAVVFLVGSLSSAALADTAVGTFSFDVTGTNVAQFDVLNATGPNSSAFPDTSFPVTNSISLNSLSLTLTFEGGGSETLSGASYFTLAPDGLSLNGTALSTITDEPAGLAGVLTATLTGTFSNTTFVLNDGTTITVGPNFSVLLTDPTGGPLQDGDVAVIFAGPGSGPPPIPEPSSFILAGTGIASLLGYRKRLAFRPLLRKFSSKGTMTLATMLVLVAFIGLVPLASHAVVAPVKLGTVTTPSSGSAGVNNVWVTGSGFPSGSVTTGGTSIVLATTCGGANPSAASPLKVGFLIGTSDRIEFLLPSSLATGNYFVSISGSTSTGNAFASSNCAQVQVTNTSSTLASCLPSSSMAVLTGTSVSAYVPNGFWDDGGSTGVRVVPLEGSGSPASISTPHIVNACSSNSKTGETVCTANNTDVYLITGTTLNRTLSSSSNTTASFSGGSCSDCGVAIDALTNTAVITGGFTGGASDQGVQLLNLASNSFSTPFPTQVDVSENVSIDPNRNLILSPDESGIYDLLKISPSGTLTEYQNNISGGELDSAAEDCTTGIALSTREFTDQLFIVDLTQATFTTGSPNTWSAPGQFVTFPEFGPIQEFEAGTSGISVAPGTTHLGVVAGEFGGNAIGVFKLPSTSGSGTPAFVDDVEATLPNDPAGNTFSLGFDPHTITAYTSPNSGKAFGVVADWASGSPDYLAVIDLAAMLAAPRVTCSGCTSPHTVDPTYDLIAHNVVRYVKTF